MPTTTPRPRPSGVEGWAETIRPRKISAEADQVVPVLQVGHELRAAGLGRREPRSGSTRTTDVVVGDPGDADDDQQQRDQHRTENRGPRAGSRGSCCWSSASRVLLGADDWLTLMTSRHRSRATLVGVTPGSHASPAEPATPTPREPRRRWDAVADRYAGGGAAQRRPVRGQRRQQRGHRPAARPLHRPRVAGRAARPGEYDGAPASGSPS